MSRSIVGEVRRAFLAEQAKLANDLPGNVAEVGVWRGGTAKLLAETMPDKTIYLFDTFSGMPPVDAVDKHKAGDFGDTSLEEVQEYLKPFANVKIYPGLFPDSTQELHKQPYSLIHVDVDIYTSTKAACEFFWPLLVKNGIMVFDDYNAPTCPGANKAIDEFFSQQGLHVTVSGKNKRCGTHIVKPW